MGCMGCARRKVNKEGLVRIQRVHVVQIVDRIIRHGGDQVEVRVIIVWVDLSGVTVEVARLPLAGVAAHKAVEIFETQAGRPLVKRPDPADRVIRRIVILAESGCNVAVFLENSGNGCIILGHETVVARVTV